MNSTNFQESISVGQGSRLTEFCPSDVSELVEALNDPEVYRTTLQLPFPYKAADAEKWVQISNREHERLGRRTHWALRYEQDQVVGGLSLMFQSNQLHRAELGYWIARKYWGQGHATRLVRVACKLAFQDFGLARLFAQVFEGNGASMRVLEKNEFVPEGILKAHFCKDGQLISSHLFGRLNPQESADRPERAC